MLFSTAIVGHSFVSCTNFFKNETGYYCQGFPRSYADLLMEGGETFAYSITGQSVKSPCSPKATKDAYTSQYPISQVKSGSQITLSWPSAGHTAGDEKAMTPSPVDVYWSKTSASEPKTLAEWKATPVATGLTFSNCLSGNVLCTGNVTIPEASPGVYAFFWIWANYTSCFDYQISENPVNTAISNINITSPPGSDMGDMDMGDNKKNSATVPSYFAILGIVAAITIQ